MDKKLLGKIVNSNKYPGVKFGKNVILYGKVIIKKGTYIGDNSIIGKPTADHIIEKNPLRETIISSNVYIGACCIIYNGAKIGQGVRIEERCNIGWDSIIGNKSQVIYGSQLYYKVNIGRRCIIGGFCCDRVKIEDDVIMFGKLMHKFSPKLIKRFSNPIALFNSNIKEKSPIIKKKAVIGFDAIIIGGIEIGSSSYISAGAIVTKNVASRNIVIGKRIVTYEEWKKRNKKAK